MKKFIMLVFMLAVGMFNIVGCGDKTAKSDVSDADGAVTDASIDNTDMDKIGGDVCPCVMVNGVVYYDTGYKSSLDNRCDRQVIRVTITEDIIRPILQLITLERNLIIHRKPVIRPVNSSS